MQDWTKIKPYGEDAYTYWISGIYKITSYREGEYLAFFIQDHYKNWGDHPSSPPDTGEYGKCWNSFEKAAKACVDHSLRHTPKPATVTRALEIKATLIEQAKEYQ